MKQLVTKGIILSRTDYGEADRIITILTPDQGKLRLMARGVRKVKSKLAGGIELFSISDITYLPGKGDIGTLVSSRLDKHYGGIVKNIGRVQLGYDLIKQLNKVTEDNTEPDYFVLMQQSFEALNDSNIKVDLVFAWFQAQLLKLAGHMPNMQTNVSGENLKSDKKYNFDFDSMSFIEHSTGRFAPNQIKILRLLFSDNSLKNINRVQGLYENLNLVKQLITSLNNTVY